MVDAILPTLEGTGEPALVHDIDEYDIVDLPPLMGRTRWEDDSSDD
jgi:hypothetical protein